MVLHSTFLSCDVEGVNIHIIAMYDKQDLLKSGLKFFYDVNDQQSLDSLNSWLTDMRMYIII